MAGNPGLTAGLPSPILGLTFCCFCLEILFEQGSLRFHFALGPAQYVSLQFWKLGRC